VTPERLAELRALAEGATPGPWESMFTGGALNPINLEVYCLAQRITGINVATVGLSPGSGAEPGPYCGKDADADFIAAARTAVPELLDYAASLRADVKALAEGNEELLADERALTAERDALKAECERLEKARAQSKGHVVFVNKELAAMIGEMATLTDERDAARTRIAELAEGINYDAAVTKRLRARVALLEAVVRGCLPSLDPSAIARYDALAEAFYQDTRIMAPGKSVPMEMANSMPPDDVRQDQWQKWHAARLAKLHADALAALDVPGVP
jgi:hypothetical protein